MSNNPLEFTDKQVLDLTKLIKIISESIRSYIESTNGTPSALGNDTSLYAMQVLSLMCGLSRGYSGDQLDDMWAASTKLSRKLYAAKVGDKTESDFQKPVQFSKCYKN